jgi:hypothetical protein
MKRRSFISRTLALFQPTFLLNRKAGRPLPANVRPLRFHRGRPSVSGRCWQHMDDPREKKQRGKSFWDKEAWVRRLTEWSREDIPPWCGGEPNELQNGRHALIRFQEFPRTSRAECGRERTDNCADEMVVWASGATGDAELSVSDPHCLHEGVREGARRQPMATSATVHMFHTVGYGGRGVGA